MKASSQQPAASRQKKAKIIPANVRPLLRTIGEVADAHGMRAYAVGGCVRDWLLGLKGITDLDVTIEGNGMEVARAVSRVLKGSLHVHQQFGTATVVLPRMRVDVATCRKETYTKPAAYPRIAAGTLRDDLRRRDFTINAMAIAIHPHRFGVVVDPCGGRKDLTTKTLRILHRRSFLDDPSRILRGVRFVQRFGLRWERSTLRAAREAMAEGALGWLNAGRLRKELDRMRAEPHPRACLDAFAWLLTRRRSQAWS
jgi:tRNA nucleotidyltransferase (CCA-adding enzyme)